MVSESRSSSTTDTLTRTGAVGALPESGRRGIVYSIVCCLIPLACVLLATPFADSAFGDDWSYADVALKLAQTGRLHYNGWGSPMILFQTIWGATWIHTIGFSFNLLRIITLPFSLGFIWLVYLIGRRAGLREANATFGALVVGTSPLFLPLAASFMTEPYACFFTAMCIYSAIRGAEAPSRGSATLWLWVLALSGIVGGADRQSVWVAPITLIPYLWWARRSDHRFRLYSVSAYVVSIVCIALLVHYFTQPYIPFDMSHSQLAALLIRSWQQALGRLTSLFLSCALVALPVLLCFTPLWRKLEPALIFFLLVGSGLTVAALMFFFGRFGVAPFVGDIATPFGIFWEGEDALGYRPIVMSLAVRIGLSVLVMFSIAAFLCVDRRKIADPVPAVAVLVIFLCGYASLLPVPAFADEGVHDRYVLPLLIALVPLLLQRLQLYRSKIPVTASACLVVFAAYSVATTHDYFGATRSRTLAAHGLERLGIPRSRISAGVEYDGWTQLQFAGGIRPLRYGDPIEANTTNKFWFWTYTTAVQPDYLVTYSERRGPVNGLPSLSFKTWLPPFRRYVTVCKYADLGNSR